MKEVFTHIDSARVGLCHSLLEEAGIACYIRNENSSPAGVPIPVFYPAVCILNDGDFERALAIVSEHQQAISQQSGEWLCPNCQSKVPAGFDTCWNCEQERQSNL